MKQLHLILIGILIPLNLASCIKVSEEIHYGKDNCHWCQMKIMDPQFGAEAITDKGRVFKFDSGECLIHYLNKTKSGHSMVLVTDYSSPKSLIDAQSAWYLISEKVPSPMGAYLSAHASEKSARSYHVAKGGMIYSWDQVITKLAQ
ncbi:MAG: nitrous oxide reductase accessory protein NosL [Flavobacteriales bacterium]|nr:nitrous oxide reductase accessory protein NosL [Bacteroidota bacterium]MCB9241303.1 nitrous oxide reductase accessory protein NosL [Flavobacteriales bacterium]